MTDASEKDPKTGRFLPGNSGFGGRPVGSRNKLGEAFIEDLHDDWKEHGKEALIACREDEPAAYCRIVASLLPKEIDVRVNVLDELSDDDIAVGFAAIRAARKAGEARAALPKPNGHSGRPKASDPVH